jgi:hypothetical protein
MFHTFVASVHLDLAYVLQWFSSIFHVFFVNVSDACLCFIYLLCILQLLYLDIAKVDRLHMECAWEAADNVGDVRGGVGSLLGCAPTS